MQISHGGSQGFKSPHLNPTYLQVRASPVRHRRRSCCSRGHLGPHWGHGRPACAAERRCPRGPAGRCRGAHPGGHGAPHRPPGTGARSDPGEAHRGMAGPRRNLLGIRTSRDPQRHRRVPKIVDAQPIQADRQSRRPPHRARNAVTRSGPSRSWPRSWGRACVGQRRQRPGRRGVRSRRVPRRPGRLKERHPASWKLWLQDWPSTAWRRARGIV
jgi:hypothetical protein